MPLSGDAAPAVAATFPVVPIAAAAPASTAVEPAHELLQRRRTAKGANPEPSRERRLPALPQRGPRTVEFVSRATSSIRVTRLELQGCDHYCRFFHRGARFPRNASTPSLPSSVKKSQAMACPATL